MRHSKKKIVPFVFASGLLASSLAQAAQLGKLEIKSGSGEPFLAEIQIDQIKPEERATLQAKLASAEAFKAARLTMDPNLKNLQFSIQGGAQAGNAVLKITASQPLPAGFIDALVELTWAGGRVAREYTLSIPANAAKTPEQAASLPEIRPPQKLPELAESKPESPAAQAKSSQDMLTVKKGDTLSEMAQQLTGDGVTLNQAMAAIYEANRGAFINNSVHLVREGVQLQIPNRAALKARNTNEALLVLAQNDDRNVYSAYARQIGLLTVQKQAGSAPATSAQGEIAPRSKEPKASTADKTDRLQIAPSAASGKANSDSNAEELLAKNKALAEANERIALLEKNVSDLQRLLDMQKDLTSPPADGTGPATAEPAAPAAEQQPAEADQPGLEVASESVAEPAAPPAVQEEPAPVPAPPTAAEAPFNWMPWALGGAGGLLLLLTALLVARSRRNKAKEEVEPFEPEEPSLFSEVNEFDVAIAAASANLEPEKQGALNKAENSEFDLDEVLNQSATRAEPAQADKPAFTATERSEPPESDSSIPELNEASPQALQQKESLDSEVTLEFPEEDTPQPKPNSILDDLDDLEKGTLAAQEELDEIRKQPQANAAEPDPDLMDDPDELPASASKPMEAQPSPEMVELDLDLPTAKVDDATWQEVATKLDLAGAYVEIGDADGARELLNEIMKKGDADQIRKAKALLATLG